MGYRQKPPPPDKSHPDKSHPDKSHPDKSPPNMRQYVCLCAFIFSPKIHVRFFIP